MVESTALEMRHTRKGIVGSNPTLSARYNKAARKGGFVVSDGRDLNSRDKVGS